MLRQRYEAILYHDYVAVRLFIYLDYNTFFSKDTMQR